MGGARLPKVPKVRPHVATQRQAGSRLPSFIKPSPPLVIVSTAYTIINIPPCMDCSRGAAPPLVTAHHAAREGHVQLVPQP